MVEDKFLLHLSEGDDFFNNFFVALFFLLTFWRGILKYNMANIGSF